MESSIYVSLSGQIALQRRLDTIAGNVASSSTAGYRAENVTFRSVLSRGRVQFSGEPATTFLRHAGSLTATGNALDVAVQGDAFFAISAPGRTTYTRGGQFQVSASGELVTLEGHPVLDSGGAPLRINPAQGPIEIARNGAVSQNGARIATLGLFRLPPESRLMRGPGAGLVSDRPAEPVTDFSETGVLQGYLEGANVSPVIEVTRLIAVSRAFESLSAAIDQSDRQLTDAIRALGGSR
jgi:flagellar basal-body rod protein FlgF